MKTLLFVVAMILSVARIDAAYLNLDGELTWNITVPECQFRLKGELQNLTSEGTGALKLVLWASKFSYPPTVPSPSTGYAVGEFTLGSLPGSRQFNSFTVDTRSDVPFINGDFYFTIAVMELTTAGWRNQMLIPTGLRKLYNGDFVDQEKWQIPAKPLFPPLPSLEPGNIIGLSEKATEDFNEFPIGWREKFKLTLKNLTKLTYANRNRSAKVSYKYSIVKARFRNRKVSAGQLVVTSGSGKNLTFKNTITLFFQGPGAGTYKSVLKGELWTGASRTSTTWGSFKVK